VARWTTPPATDLIVVPLFETIEDLRNAAPIMREFYALPGIAKLVQRSGAEQDIMLGYSATATRTAASSPATGSCTAPRSRWWTCLTSWPTATTSSCACSTAAAARWAGRWPQLPGHPGAAPGHRARADPADRTGRGDRLQVRQPGNRPAQPGNPGGRHAGSHLLQPTKPATRPIWRRP
jgi:hypothetical protein